MRLTIRNSDGSVSQPTDLRWADALSKLADYEDAEEQGRLVILPEKLYDFYDWDVTGVRYYDSKVQAYCVRHEQTESIIYGREIGNTVFLSREEAEAALKGEAKDV